MTSRVLPPAEWDRLGATDIPQLLPLVHRDDVQIVVVEDEGQIVGAWAALRIVHLEGVWIAPTYRGRAAVARRLLARTLAVARAWAPWALTGAATDDVRRLIERHLRGTKVPMDLYAIHLSGEHACQSSH